MQISVGMFSLSSVDHHNSLPQHVLIKILNLSPHFSNQCSPRRKGGDCSFQGVCSPESNLCECNEGYFGGACQFHGPCTEMIMHEEFHGYGQHAYQKSFDLLYLERNPVMVYGRPVYVQKESPSEDIFEVILYGWKVVGFSI